MRSIRSYAPRAAVAFGRTTAVPLDPIARASTPRAPAPVGDAASPSAKTPLPALTIAAIGIVYGDIGTSPLYTMREAFGDIGALPLTEASVLGVLSLMFWALIVVVTLKYVIVILAADNRGEGGILACSPPSCRATCGRAARPCSCWPWSAPPCSTATALITPAISVLSAVEGLQRGDTRVRPLRGADRARRPESRCS